MSKRSTKFEKNWSKKSAKPILKKSQRQKNTTARGGIRDPLETFLKTSP